MHRFASKLSHSVSLGILSTQCQCQDSEVAQREVQSAIALHNFATILDCPFADKLAIAVAICIVTMSDSKQESATTDSASVLHSYHTSMVVATEIATTDNFVMIQEHLHPMAKSYTVDFAWVASDQQIGLDNGSFGTPSATVNSYDDAPLLATASSAFALD